MKNQLLEFSRRKPPVSNGISPYPESPSESPDFRVRRPAISVSSEGDSRRFICTFVVHPICGLCICDKKSYGVVLVNQEPHIEVMSPGSKGVQFYIMNRLLVYMYREFQASEKRGLHPSICADELFSLFPNFSETFLRKRLKSCADLQRGPNGHFHWVMKCNFRLPSDEELRRMVTPENMSI